ncbi:MAG TPA: flagellar hook-associated protein FlgL [Terriglobales bacterium]|nr:flagellar hook-associated protein FlgL [Terriglobales bacterium]
MYSRITSELLNRNLLDALDQTQQSQSTALTQVETQRRVNVPSDDPVAAALSSGNQAQAAQITQFLQNINSLNGELQVGDSALSSATSLLNRALTLGTQGATGTLSATDRSDLGQEVSQVMDEMVNIANTTFNGAYVFAGTAGGPAYAADATQADGVRYNGNNSTNQVQIAPGASVTINQPGSQIFQNGSGSIFQSLYDLKNALNSNDPAAAQTAVTELSSAVKQLGQQRVFYGSTLNRLSSTQTFLSNEQQNLTQQETTLVGTDLASALTQLSAAQTARTAILTAGGHLSQLSLLNYLQ